ncbi:MAG: hypothetical protein ACP59X_04440 [Solidesulfovibrio sp. DCME]|uniref:hypothetical protein n=1 Tax=Solidesulfovibrio sp. DCME TaxID=3447380 RepID=UPI003D0BBA1F
MPRLVALCAVVCLLPSLFMAALPNTPPAFAQTPAGRNLVFSTYLGGTLPFAGASPLTFAQNAASDAAGNTYVTGATQVYDLSVRNAFQSAPAADCAMAAFVAKFSPVGQLLWCTYLGGNKQSMGIGVAAMPDGGVAVSGLTTSDTAGAFPTKNAFQAQNNGLSDYFLAVFDAQGGLRYATYLGGSGEEGTPQPNTFADDSNNGNNVAVDANGLVYVTGITDSGADKAIEFPVTPNALQHKLAGGKDAFLCIIDPGRSGSESLTYASFLGGKGDDKGHSVAVDASGGHIAVAGFTNSQDFPVTATALRDTAPPVGYSSNGYVTQIGSSQPGSPASQYTLLYSTYLGGNTVEARDDAYGVALDPTGLLVATGRTQSADFPMTQGGATIYNRATYLEPGKSGDEPYVVKIDPARSGSDSLVYATFLGGGSKTDAWGSFCTSLGLDGQGGVYVAGETCAPGQAYTPGDPSAPETFPYTNNALFTALQGSWDAIFMQIAPGGTVLGYSTYLGGSANDRTYGLAVDSARNVVLSGLTFSENFPLRNPAKTWPGNIGYQNAFVAKFAPNVPETGPCFLLLGN